MGKRTKSIWDLVNLTMKWLLIPKEYTENKSTIQVVIIGRRKICLVYQQNRWFAFQTRCPHAGAPLVHGFCKDRVVICPYHRHQFDLETGRGAAGQGNYIEVYPVKEENSACYVGMKPTFWERFFKRS